MKKRCSWVNNNPFSIKYHDEEWGIPLHNDRKLFEFLLLDSFQAGLNWVTVLKKRESFKKAFDNFNYLKIATYDEEKVQNLLSDKGIIRNRLKIDAAISNAKEFIKIQKEFGTFDKYIWKFVNHKTIKNSFKTWHEVPATSKESEEMSKDLKKRGFKFVGATICYAFMQAAGMVNDHEITCFRYNEI